MQPLSTRSPAPRLTTLRALRARPLAVRTRCTRFTAAVRVFSFALLLGSQVVAEAVEAEASKRPDVVVFVIDTLRADRLGAYGFPRPTSPAIDALAKQGVLFEDASAPAPWTLPSVVSMMTSMFPCEHGVRVDGERIREGVVPLAQHLQRAGYETVSFVANGYAGKASGLDRGFDRPSTIAKLSDQTVRRWLNPKDDRPFFLYIHEIRPHDPYQAEIATIGVEMTVPLSERRRVNQRLQGYRELTKVDFDAGRTPGTTDNAAEQASAMAWLAERRTLIETLYAAEIRAADTVVGEIIQVLRELGRWENTLFILTSDHGEEFDEHGGWQHDQSVYEELLRVPLIVRFPHDASAGRRVAAPVSLVDLSKTVLGHLGLTPEEETPSGRSWLPLLQATAPPGAGRVVAERHNEKKYFGPTHGRRGDRNVAIRDGAWKAIWNVGPDTVELYDLKQDPRERSELAAREPDRAGRMKGVAQEWLGRCVSQPAPRQPIDGAELERLRALGYVE